MPFLISQRADDATSRCVHYDSRPRTLMLEIKYASRLLRGRPAPVYGEIGTGDCAASSRHRKREGGYLFNRNKFLCRRAAEQNVLIT